MQWIDAIGYEEVMTFLRSTPANLFFKDTECRYLFISDVRTFFPYGEGQEEDVLGKCYGTQKGKVCYFNEIGKDSLDVQSVSPMEKIPGSKTPMISPA